MLVINEPVFSAARVNVLTVKDGPIQFYDTKSKKRRFVPISPRLNPLSNLRLLFSGWKESGKFEDFSNPQNKKPPI